MDKTAPNPRFLSNEWDKSLFDCSDNWETCLFAAFCPCIVLGKNADTRGADAPGVCYCLAYTVLLDCYACFPLGAYERHAIREQYNIKGSWVEDCLVHAFCIPCALAQESRQLKNAARRSSVALPSSGYPPTQLPPQQVMIGTNYPPTTADKPTAGTMVKLGDTSMMSKPDVYLPPRDVGYYENQSQEQSSYGAMGPSQQSFRQPISNTGSGASLAPPPPPPPPPSSSSAALSSSPLTPVGYILTNAPPPPGAFGIIPASSDAPAGSSSSSSSSSFPPPVAGYPHSRSLAPYPVGYTSSMPAMPEGGSAPPPSAPQYPFQQGAAASSNSSAYSYSSNLRMGEKEPAPSPD